jgi:hypothetical protein
MATLPKPAQVHQNKFCVSVDHPAETTTATVHVMLATRAFIVDSVYYVNPTGLAEDTTNVFSGTVNKGATVFATLFNTDSDLSVPDASIPANTWIAGVLDADSAKREFEPGDALDLVFTEGGNSTLPAGRLVVEGRYL